MFNISDVQKEVVLNLSLLGWKKEVRVRDLWKREDVGSFTKKYAASIHAHGAILLKIVAN
jgi:hypothetical protein